ncbi:YkgJ family cysteine cluster protein [Natronosalvus vescus]|uniref:YkgJ family cysteine cluster protein n=1 Tax=Natronosalvus vescus TaxID=2953881 RepID=UPI002091DC08|nr:YkgJ family cysteine cluster protein [Natronosalvus vescus]
MEVYCQGCAGCCIDWRPLLEDDQRPTQPTRTKGHDETAVDEADENGHEHERRLRRRPAIDDVYNLVPLTRDEIRAFLETGLGDVLIPRLWEADAVDDAVTVDGYDLAAIEGRPTFFVGLRKPPKPVAPFGRTTRAWLPTCVFLDPDTLQCRLHEDSRYPDECAAYPAHNVALEQETECERVERAVGGTRIRRDETAAGRGITVTVDADPTDGLLLGRQAIGQKLFVHPNPEALEGRIDRLVAGEATDEDRATFVAIAAASAPGTLSHSEPHAERARTQVLEADSWAGRAIREWERLEAADGDAPGTAVSSAIDGSFEVADGAPPTPGWDALENEEAGG